MNYSSKHGIYGYPKTNFFITISVIEIEKSDQIKVFNLTDVNLDIQSSRKYILIMNQLPENSLRTSFNRISQRVTKTAWSSIYSYVMSPHFRPVNQILISNKKQLLIFLNCCWGLNQFCTLCLALNIHKHVFS